MTALSHSFTGRPARRAASRAVSRASGRVSLTLHGKPSFIPTPTSEAETLRVGSTLGAPARVNSRWIRGSALRPHTDFLPVGVNKPLTFCGCTGVSGEFLRSRYLDHGIFPSVGCNIFAADIPECRYSCWLQD